MLLLVDDLSINMYEFWCIC